MGELDKGEAQQPLTDEDYDTYRVLADGEALPAGRTVQRLVAHRLIERDPYRVGQFITHDPRVAAQALAADALRDLGGLVDRMSQIPALEALARHFDPHRLHGGPASEFLPTVEEMNQRIGEVSAAAGHEFASVQPAEPTDRDPEILRLGVLRTRAALARGVRVKSLYHRSSYGHEQTRAHIDQLVADGADVRVSDDPGPRMVIIDSRHLFADNHIVPDAEGNSGWHVIDRAVVMFARRMFSNQWGKSTRWEELHRSSKPSLLTQRQQRMLRELEESGCSQERLGPRIGLSGRTVSKELAEVRKTLGCESMLQVMVWWARSPEREIS